MWSRTLRGFSRCAQYVTTSRIKHIKSIQNNFTTLTKTAFPIENRVSFKFQEKTCRLSTESENHISDEEMKKCIQSLGEKFSEARELLNDARESMDTVYFSEDMKEAEEAVTETLEEYSSLLLRLNTQQKEEVLRTIGLRMQELKAQVAAIHESLHD